ncbi:MAG TPA: DUF2892 domain-containing protein [Gemmatimonadales bacterium]|jgi:hypothetical protein|nr:DUF2892 domain-containing protein [Gemmatimonadales bacterium]
MCDERIIRRIAGVFVMVSVGLGLTAGAGWLWFTLFVGFNLFQSSLTGFCPLEQMLGRLGLFGCRPRATPMAR